MHCLIRYQKGASNCTVKRKSGVLATKRGDRARARQQPMPQCCVFDIHKP